MLLKIWIHFYYSQLEGALSQWTSYQEDVGQFVQWMERVEETLSCSDRQYSEMRDKTANLGKTKVSFVLPSRMLYVMSLMSSF